MALGAHPCKLRFTPNCTPGTVFPGTFLEHLAWTSWIQDRHKYQHRPAGVFGCQEMTASRKHAFVLNMLYLSLRSSLSLKSLSKPWHKGCFLSTNITTNLRWQYFWGHYQQKKFQAWLNPILTTDSTESDRPFSSLLKSTSRFCFCFNFLNETSAENQLQHNCDPTELSGRANNFWMNILVISDIIHFYSGVSLASQIEIKGSYFIWTFAFA